MPRQMALTGGERHIIMKLFQYTFPVEDMPGISIRQMRMDAKPCVARHMPFALPAFLSGIS